MSYKSYSSLGQDPNKNSQNSSPEVPSIRNKQERDMVLSKNRIVVIDNYADWCGPCQQLEPVFRKLAQKYTKPGLCMFYKENVDDKVLGAQQLTGVPTFHVYLHGKYLPEFTIVGGDINTLEQTIHMLVSQQLNQTQ